MVACKPYHIPAAFSTSSLVTQDVCVGLKTWCYLVMLIWQWKTSGVYFGIKCRQTVLGITLGFPVLVIFTGQLLKWKTTLYIIFSPIVGSGFFWTSLGKANWFDIWEVKLQCLTGEGKLGCLVQIIRNLKCQGYQGFENYYCHHLVQLHIYTWGKEDLFKEILHFLTNKIWVKSSSLPCPFKYCSNTNFHAS